MDGSKKVQLPCSSEAAQEKSTNKASGALPGSRARQTNTTWCSMSMPPILQVQGQSTTTYLQMSPQGEVKSAHKPERPLRGARARETKHDMLLTVNASTRAHVQGTFHPNGLADTPAEQSDTINIKCRSVCALPCNGVPTLEYNFDCLSPPSPLRSVVLTRKWSCQTCG